MRSKGVDSRVSTWWKKQNPGLTAVRSSFRAISPNRWWGTPSPLKVDQQALSGPRILRRRGGSLVPAFASCQDWDRGERSSRSSTQDLHVIAASLITVLPPVPPPAIIRGQLVMWGSLLAAPPPPPPPKEDNTPGQISNELTDRPTDRPLPAAPERAHRHPDDFGT